MHSIVSTALLFFLLVIASTTVDAFDYVLSPSEAVSSYTIRLVDVTTNVSNIATLFRNANATIHVDGLAWQTSQLLLLSQSESSQPQTEISTTTYWDVEEDKTTTVTEEQTLRLLQTARLAYTTYLDQEAIASGSHALSTMVPPSTITAGSIQIDTAGRHNLTVSLQVVYTTTLDVPILITMSPRVSTTRFYQSYQSWVTVFPIFVLLGLGWMTGNTEISISTTNLVSVCIAHGDFFRGMEHLVNGCILGALTNPFNGTIMLLVFFLCGVQSLVRVSGGSKGLVRFVARYITHTTRVVHIMAFIMGLGYFWDDVLSILCVGHLLRPLLDMAHTSRPLFAMILHATAGPMTSLVVLSTWLSWEIPLLQQELDRLQEGLLLSDTNHHSSLLFNMTPLEVLKKSIRYSFYPIFILILMPLLLWSQRQFGYILMYERITQVYQAKDGGPRDIRGPGQEHLPVPRGVPCRFWNACFPIGVITLLFLFFWFQTGQTNSNATDVENDNNDDESEGSPATIIFANSDVSLAWLQAISMGTAIYVVSLLLQWQDEHGSILCLPLNLTKLSKHPQQKIDDKEEEEEEEQQTLEKSAEEQMVDEEDIIDAHDDDNNNNDEGESFKPLIPMMDLIASFFFGFSHVMPFMIQFILAWALRASLTEMGFDRWIASSLLGDQLDQLDMAFVPTAAFLTAFFMSLAVGGAARGNVASILLPMTVAPVYQATYATNPDMVFQVIGAILSGCVAGDHAAPLSNTTLLSCLSSDCHVLVHAITQLPYIVIVVLLSLIFGTLPVGYGIYPVGAGYFLGVVCLLFFVFFLCYPVLDPNGQWDLATRLYIRLCVRRPSTTTIDDVNHGTTNDPELQQSQQGDGAHNDEQQHGNFWEMLQRDTIRAATALAQGLPYDTEDCRHLMHTVDSGVTAVASRTPRGEDEEEEVLAPIATSSSYPSSSVMIIGDGGGGGAAWLSQESDNLSKKTISTRPVRIIAADGRGGTMTEDDNISLIGSFGHANTKAPGGATTNNNDQAVIGSSGHTPGIGSADDALYSM